MILLTLPRSLYYCLGNTGEISDRSISEALSRSRRA